jgi:RNA polymerase sigma-70 factor (ECF subfamily)
LDDRALFERLAAGDEAALELWVERYHRPLFAFLFRLTDDRALADDLAQEAFIRVLNYRGVPPQHFRGWMFTIARNLAHDHFRSRAYRHEQPAGEMEADTAADDVSPEQYAMMLDGQRQVVEALQALPPDQREVVILRFYHDLPLDEISEITGAPLGTVKSRLFHALKKLKAQLTEMAKSGSVVVGTQRPASTSDSERTS